MTNEYFGSLRNTCPELLLHVVKPLGRRPFLIVKTCVDEINVLFLVIECKQAIGKDHTGVGVSRMMSRLPPALSFYFIAKVAHKSAVEIEWQLGCQSAAYCKLRLQKVEQWRRYWWLRALRIQEQLSAGGVVRKAQTMRPRCTHERES